MAPLCRAACRMDVSRFRVTGRMGLAGGAPASPAPHETANQPWSLCRHDGGSCKFSGSVSITLQTGKGSHIGTSSR